jgi:hypothetical protein
MSDIWSMARATLSTVAPVLASMVGGPLAGAATGAVIKALNLAPDTAPEVVAQAVVGATPDQLLALKKADQEFAAQMKQLDVDASALAYKDTADARAREVAVKDHTPSVIAYVLTGGFFSLLGAMMFHPLPADNKDLLNIMLGALGASFGMAVSYYFGSSNKATSISTPPGK